MSKPEKVIWLAKKQEYVTEEQKEKAALFLTMYYDKQLIKHEHEEKNSWCEFENFDIIDNPSKGISNLVIKWKARGRAWYIMRNFRSKNAKY